MSVIESFSELSMKWNPKKKIIDDPKQSSNIQQLNPRADLFQQGAIRISTRNLIPKCNYKIMIYVSSLKWTRLKNANASKRIIKSRVIWYGLASQS